MFVELADFDGYPYNLPNLNKKENTFTDFAKSLEGIVLQNLLGYEFYKTLTTGIEAETQIYLDIRDGKEYIYDGKTFKYGGLKPLLVPYIYSQWIIEDYAPYVGAGKAQAKVQNSEIVSPIGNVTRGWMDFLSALGFRERFQCYEDEYYEHLISQENSLYGLLESSSEYSGYEYNYPGMINRFNL